MTRQDDSGHPGALCTAQDRAQIVGIGDAVEDQQERQSSPLGGLAQRLERGLLDRPGQGDDALRTVRAGSCIDPLARDVVHLDPALCGQRLDIVEDLGGVHAFGHEQRRHRTAPGAQQLADRLASLDLIAPEPLVLRSAADRDIATARSPSAIVDRRPCGSTGSTTRGRPTARRRAPAGLGVLGLHPGGLCLWPLAGRRAAGAPLGRRCPRALAPSTTRCCRTHRTSPGRSAVKDGAAASRTTAVQAMPSARPSAPRPSARVALTFTGAPSATASRSAMVAT